MLEKIWKNFKKEFWKLLFIFFGLIVFILYMWLMRAFMTNFDERDMIAAGYLMTKGRVLYLDIFSHHFPLPYVWVAMFGSFWAESTAARGISIFRMTLCLYYLLSTILVFVSLRRNLERLIFVLFLVSILPLFTLFHGNLILSESFASFPLISLGFISFLASINRKLINENISIWVSIILCSFCFWTQPLLIVTYLIPIFLYRKQLRKVIILGTISAIIPLLIMCFNGSISSFISQGLWFNFKIYPKYYYDIEGVQPGLLGLIGKFISNQTLFLTGNISNNLALLCQLIGSWFLLISMIVLVWKKKWKILTLFICLYAMVRIREVKIVPGSLFNFGVFPYMMLINLGFILTIFMVKKWWLKTATIVLFSFYFIGLVKLNAPIIEQSLKPGYNYHVFWSDRQKIGDGLAINTNPNDSILIYPHDVDIYYFAKRVPPDKFLYWFPWINDVPEYRRERMESINTNKAKAIYLGDMKFKNDQYYYSKLLPIRTDGYIEVSLSQNGMNIWVKK